MLFHRVGDGKTAEHGFLSCMLHEACSGATEEGEGVSNCMGLIEMGQGVSPLEAEVAYKGSWLSVMDSFIMP